MADYFIGHASEYNAGPSVPQNKRDKAISLYTADTWKATPRLTVNYGVRWQPYTPMINRDGGAMNFDLNKLQQGVKSVRFDNTPPGTFFNGDPGFPGDAGIFNRWLQFAPRLGLAWDVNGDGKTSIRASGGSSYDFPNTSLHGQPDFRTTLGAEIHRDRCTDGQSVGELSRWRPVANQERKGRGA